jgi:hypothetical protein
LSVSLGWGIFLLGWGIFLVSMSIDHVASALRELAERARELRWRELSWSLRKDDDEPDEPDDDPEPEPADDEPDEGEETMWSITSRGKVDDVRKAVAEQFDFTASVYTCQGMREGNDLVVLRAVVLGSIDTLKVDADKEEVVVYCYGSRGEDSYMSCSLSVTKEAKAAPPAPPATKPELPSAQ